LPKITPIHWRKLEQVFLKAGFRFARQEGSHRSYVKEGISRPIVIPTYDEKIKYCETQLRRQYDNI